MDAAPKRQLTLFDSICIIVGVIVGVGIYETSPTIADVMPGWWGVLGIWAVGGLLALAGALCYAELATAYPRSGGDYVYLSRAYGPWAGYLFGWSKMTVLRPGDIAMMVFVFGRYASTIYAPWGPGASILVYAALAVVALTAINVIGVRAGKWTQNVLTVVKAVGLLAIAAAGLFAPAGLGASGGAEGLALGGVQLGLILVLFTYGGWSEIAYVAAEVRRPERNLVRSLVLGTVAVIALYLLVNAAFLAVLGQGGVAGSKAVATDTVASVLPDLAARVVSVLICISALGAANGLIFAGARITAAMGADHSLFRRLGNRHVRLGTPATALLVQGAISLAIVLIFRSFIDTILYTAPAVWLFFLATGASVLVLRFREPRTERPYRVTGGPVTVLLFCASAAFMMYSCITFALKFRPIGLIVSAGLLLTGAVLYLLIPTMSGRGRHSARS